MAMKMYWIDTDSETESRKLLEVCLGVCKCVLMLNTGKRLLWDLIVSHTHKKEIFF